MSEEAKILEVGLQIGDWTPPDGGPAVPKWSVKVGNASQQVSGNMIAKNAPTVGEAVLIEDKGGFWKISRPKKPYGGGGGGGGFKSDPATQKSIVRQHSQHMAILYAGVRGIDLISVEQLKPIIDWFEEDAGTQTPFKAVSDLDSFPSEPATADLPF